MIENRAADVLLRLRTTCEDKIPSDDKFSVCIIYQYLFASSPTKETPEFDLIEESEGLSTPSICQIFMMAGTETKDTVDRLTQN